MQGATIKVNLSMFTPAPQYKQRNTSANLWLFRFHQFAQVRFTAVLSSKSIVVFRPSDQTRTWG
jgi:hypothetical protein